MLPRVSAAISQFISPIASSTRDQQRKGPSFQRFNAEREAAPKKEDAPQEQPPKEPPKDSKPSLDEQDSGAKVIPIRKPEPGVHSVSQAFIQMLGMIQARRATLLKWLGAKSYQTALRDRKKSGRFRKGAMLDQKAE